MWRRLRDRATARRLATVELRERLRVCDRRCRAGADRERARVRALSAGVLR
jgi:hypothetical protein